MAHSKAAWLMGEDEEEMSLERTEAGNSIILSFLSPQGFYSLLNDTGNLESILCEKKNIFLFQNNLSVVHLGCMESADCGRVRQWLEEMVEIRLP